MTDRSHSDAAGAPVDRPNAHGVDRDEARKRLGADIRHAMDLLGQPVADLARRLGLSPTYALDQLAGKEKLGIEVLSCLRPSVRIVLLQRWADEARAAESRLHGDPDVSAGTLQAASSLGELAYEVRMSMADGVLEDDEIDRIDSRAAEGIVELTKVQHAARAARRKS